MTLRSDQALLTAWVTARTGDRVRRPLALLEQSLETDAAVLARWPLGRRDAGLIDALVDAFGGMIEAIADCRACGEEMEVAFAAQAIRAPHAGDEPIAVGGGLAVRAPTTDDLAAALAAGDDEAAVARALAARCAGAGEPVDDDELAAIAAAIDGLDPQADVRLAVTCPACGTAGEVGFDVADYLWRLVEARVRELVVDVDALARAYGWSEAEVLALPRERRELYLELVGA